MNSNQSSLWLKHISSSGYRLTEPLRVMVQVFSTSPRALEPAEIHEIGRALHPSLGLVTVYRSLDKLVELGLVQRVHQAGACNRYIRACIGHEHLLICRNCGEARYFSGDDLSALQAKITGNSGYLIEDHWLQFVGLCKKCQQLEETGA